MSNSLQQHGPQEVHKQLRTRMKIQGLDTIKVQVTRRAGKLQIDFTGSADQVTKAKKILADWT
jgi:N-methylhydantoinase B/oxoprolinase/acetone carboxylase alpha subunit